MMRKVLVSGMSAVMAVAVGAGVLFAQDTETTGSAWLGVSVVEQNDQVVINRVQPGSPAETAELLIGDVVIAINGVAVDSPEDVRAEVQAAAPGDTLTLEYIRAGETVSEELVLGSAPAGLRGGRGREFGLPTDALSAAERLLHADLETTDAGFEVVTVSDRNPLTLAVGDVITTINGQAVAELNVETLVAELTAATQPQITVVLARNGEDVTVSSDVRLGGGGRGHGGHSGPGRGLGQGEGVPDGNRGNGSLNDNLDVIPEVTPEATPNV